MGNYIESYLAEEATAIGQSVEHVKAWNPPEQLHKGRKKDIMSNDQSESNQETPELHGPAFISWRASSWRDAVTVAEQMYGWLFRGQKDATWRLTTSLERVAADFSCPLMTLPEREEEIINQFKRQAHQYLPHLPDDEDNLEWLSLIQHFGGPTRLLDFTRSFYVGAFFAMEMAAQDAVVWAINQSPLEENFLNVAADPPKVSQTTPLAESKCRTVQRCIRRSFNEYVTDHSFRQCGDDKPDRILDLPNVIAVKPWQLNQRLIIQQGWFLFPTRLDATFVQNLCNSLGVPGASLPEKDSVETLEELKALLANPKSKLTLVKMTFPREMHRDAIQDLHQMNVTAATLFPGLDGFARSLHYRLRLFDGGSAAKLRKLRKVVK